jgi:hypothetical protein
MGSFVLTASFYVETLLELGEFVEARAFAQRSLAQCAAQEILSTDALERGLAVAESRLGEHASAAARLDRLLARQRSVGVTGLILGATYEARARVAIAAGDAATFEEYAQLTASAYRYAQGFRVGTRYLRLMREAQRAGVQPAVQATEYESDVLSGVTLAASVIERHVASLLQDAATLEQRAARALGLISETAGARSGQLYVVERAGSLRWVAAHRTEPANEGELQHARACLARAQSDAAHTTCLLTTDHSAGPSAGSWTSTGGVVQRAFLVTAMQRQSARHMAVVLLETPSTHAGQRLHDTLRAVAHCMLQADAELGVTAVD